MKTLLCSAAALTLLPAAATATTLSSNRPFINACYSWAEVQRGDSRAMADCNRALSQEAATLNERAATLVNRGIIRMVAKDSTGAIRDFDAALSLDPGQAEAWLGKAIETWKAGDSRTAIGFADRALALGPRKPAVAYWVRGLSNEQLGNVRQAYYDLRRARALAPSWSVPAEELQRYRVVSR